MAVRPGNVSGAQKLSGTLGKSKHPNKQCSTDAQALPKHDFEQFSSFSFLQKKKREERRGVFNACAR